MSGNGSLQISGLMGKHRWLPRVVVIMALRSYVALTNYLIPLCLGFLISKMGSLWVFVFFFKFIYSFEKGRE